MPELSLRQYFICEHALTETNKEICGCDSILFGCVALIMQSGRTDTCMHVHSGVKNHAGLAS
jgi:hypothetical protein